MSRFLPFPRPWLAGLAALLLLIAAPTLAQTVGEAGGGDPNATNSDATNQGTVQVNIIPGQPEVFDGQPAVFFAATQPPGFEDQVQWTATTQNGFAQPPTGIGRDFTTVFFDTVPLCQRLTVEALLETPEGTSTAVWTQIREDDCYEDIFIPRGEDCWETNDCETKASFCINPLPMDFFAPGSHEWRDEILLKGPDNITVDTTVERLDDVLLLELDQATTRVRLVTLDLESCNPITVTYDDHEELWDVKVQQSDFPDPNPGTMTIDRTFANGGTFGSDFPVHVKYTFTNQGTGDEVILDTGDPDDEFDLDPILLKTSGSTPWVSTLDGQIIVESCGINFHPGVFGGGGGGGRQCCKKVGHKGPGHIHETGPPKCKPCPDGACYDKIRLKCRRVLEKDCNLPGEVFMGMGTDCADTDNDGLQNFAEKNNCCLAGQVSQDACNSLSDPGNADTDGDGVNDGQEILQGRDPCTPGV